MTTDPQTVDKPVERPYRNRTLAYLLAVLVIVIPTMLALASIMSRRG